ncbi:spore germination protein [Paenibacillus sp. NEAU-GSW1]|uniref:spore germination protein n=1 Tax=Paenibacillus sp. NEAU-GSW1 TaxID=2682486 RepID=UPI0012E20680|nr:spore germination protein [Paenibacillus sp. NEAU-GSW1]MUT67011.1 spore germination protein [Paenibacillus sp. NEAU-GSW1]
MNDRKETEISPILSMNIERLRTLMGGSSDFIIRELAFSNKARRGALFFLDGMVDMQVLQENVIAPLLERTPEHEFKMSYLRSSVLENGEIQPAHQMQEAIEQILSGSALLLVDGASEGLTISLSGWEDRSVTESKTQSVVRGPQDSFTETLRTNTTLVRRRVKDTRVRVLSVKVGTLTKTDVAIMYLDQVADSALVQTIVQQLQSAKQDRVLEGQYLEQILLKDKQKTIFPTLYNSDRPDSIAAGIMEGKVAIIVDGTPFVLLAPSLFVDFIQSAEDYYQAVYYSNFIRMLRYIALCICMLAPSVYIALTTFHQDMLPTQLLLSLAAQREGVPFPAFVEAVLMEFTFEILREAGIRMPRTIGQAVSIVGTIVIGQAAVEASIVSAAMVIIVSITAISSFVIPSYSMSIPIRLIRFVFMAMAASFGFYGLMIGIFILIAHLCQLQSFGIPYMNPTAPYRKKMQNDAILRLPGVNNQSNSSERGSRS